MRHASSALSAGLHGGLTSRCPRILAPNQPDITTGEKNARPEEEWQAGDSQLFAVQVGDHSKINVHPPKLWQNAKFEARGPTAQPGCGDLCFFFDGSLEAAEKLIVDAGSEVAYGPYDKKGGGEGGQQGTSIYCRDPDGNLLEFMTYPDRKG